ncbi:MAG: class I SAM-dependent methyltransferase [Anaerolineales bacterium]
MTKSEKPPVCDYEGSDYQTVFWEMGSREYEDRVEALALSRLLPKSGNLMLEIGAGAGRNTPRYQAFQRVVLVDYSTTQLQQAQANLGSSDRYIYVAADVYRLPFSPGIFDSATMIRTLHHMAEPQLALQQVRFALQPGAIFILEYANKHNLKAILRYLLGRQSWSPFTPEAVEFTELNFDFHPKSIRSWLEQSDFSIYRQLTVSHFRLGSLKRLIPLDILVKMDGLAQLTGNWWQFTPSVFVASSATGKTPITPPDEMFRCLICDQSDFDASPAALVCRACGHEWLFKNGIYDFRLN